MDVVVGRREGRGGGVSAAWLPRCCSNAPSNAPHGRVGSPKKKFDRRVRVSSAARKPRGCNAATVRRRRVDGRAATQPYSSPQKPVVAQLHDHGHLAVELDALEGDSSPMALQRVIPPTSGVFAASPATVVR